MANNSPTDKNFRSPFDKFPSSGNQSRRRKLDDFHPPVKDDREVVLEGGPEHDFGPDDHSLFRPRPIFGEGRED